MDSTDPASEPTLVPRTASASEPTIAPGAATAPLGVRRLGKFLLLEELGSGGMGTVYRARQTDLDRVVALKVLHGSSAAGATIMERFQREARAAARLVHPGIVHVFEVGEIDGVHFFSMELVDGENLLSRARRVAPPLQERVRWIRDASLALHHAHTNGLVHRDVKPHNLLIDARGEVKVADFGLARDVSSARGLTVSGELMGTPCYMSPEQARGRWDDVGPRSDVYSLGATLYELIAGAPPVEANEIYRLIEKVARGDLVPLRTRAPEVPRDLETILGKALDVDPARRYASALAFAEDLDRFLRFEAIQARAESLMERIGRRARRHRRRLAIVGLAAACVLGGTLLVRWMGHSAQQKGAAATADRTRAEAEELYHRAMDPEYVLAHGGVKAEEDLLRQAIARCPSLVAPRYRLGVVYEWTGRTEEALAAYGEAAARDPRYLQARARIATLQFLLGKEGSAHDDAWQRGNEEMNRLQSEAPDDPFVRLAFLTREALGWSQSKMRREDVVSGLEQLAPTLPDARLLLAGVRGFYYHPLHEVGFTEYLEYRDLGAAFEQLDLLASGDRLNVQALVARGLIRYELGDLAGAEQDLRLVEREAPGWDVPHYYLGRVLGSLWRLDESAAELHQTVALKREFRHLNYLGIILGLQQKYPEALGVLDESLALEPGNSDAIALRGMTLFCLGREAEASAATKEYIKAQPDYVDQLRVVDKEVARPEIQLLMTTVRQHLLEFQDILFLEPKEKQAIRTALALAARFPRLQEMAERYRAVNSVHYEMQDLVLNAGRYEREVPRMAEFFRWLGKELGLRTDIHSGSLLTQFWVRYSRDGDLVRWSRLLTASDYLWRAGTRYRTRAFDAAEADLAAALALDPHSARARYGLATIRAIRGDAAGCAQELTKARENGWTNFEWIETDPDFAKVKEDAAVKRAAKGE